MIKKILSIALICLMLILSGCSENKPLVYHRVDLTDEQKSEMREVIKKQVESNNVDTSHVSGNVKVEEIYYMVCDNDIMSELFSEYRKRVYESGETENIVIAEETELFSDSEDQYVYLFLLYESNSDRVESFDVKTAKLKDNGIHLSIDRYDRQAADDRYTNQTIILKIKKSSLKGEIKEVIVDWNVITVPEKH